MTRMRWQIGVALVLVGTLMATAAEAQRAERPERPHRERPGHGKQLQQIEQQIRAGRSVTRRIQRDPRATAAVKQQATQLETLLDARERTLTKLDAQYRDFLAQHKADLDELENLRRRALEIDGRLAEARTALMQANRADIDQLKRDSQQAHQVTEALRTAYEADRRARRGH